MTTYWVWQQVGRGSKSTNVHCWQRYRSRRIETYGRYWGIADMMSELGQILPSWPARHVHAFGLISTAHTRRSLDLPSRSTLSN